MYATSIDELKMTLEIMNMKSYANLMHNLYEIFY